MCGGGKNKKKKRAPELLINFTISPQMLRVLKKKKKKITEVQTSGFNEQWDVNEVIE